MLHLCYTVLNKMIRSAIPRFMPVLIAAAALLLNATPTAAHGRTAWYEGFEGPETTWRDVGGNAQYQIKHHRREQNKAHTGDGCERLTLLGNHGTYVHIGHEVGRPMVIDELLPSVWVKSDRPGLQIAARVVLPRVTDPRTGRPVSTLVSGSSYTNVGRWQQLRIDEVPRLLARQVRLLRTQLGPNVDGRESYIDAVLLNIYGGPGETNVWIDDLDIAGFVAAGPADGDSAIGRTAGMTPVQSNRPKIKLVGSVLMADGRAMFPRIIQHQGEPLEFLKRLGFNAVWLSRPPTAEQLSEAKRLGLWLVCTPPRSIGPEYDSVMAWDIGRGLTDEHLDATRRWARHVRSADRHCGRPLICMPTSNLRAYSRQVDLLLLDRRPVGASLELADWGTWIRRQPFLARPGTPVWTAVQTQPAPAIRRQLLAADPAADPPDSLSSGQIKLLAYTAIGSGSRGLLFTSHSPLDASDPETLQRAMTLELLNLQLQLIEHWASAGSLQATAEGTEPGVIGAVLRSNRSRLVLPIYSSPGAQYVPGQSAAGQSLVVPGVPESSNVYNIVPGGLKPLRHKRVTGGMRVALERFGLTGQMLLTQDPLTVAGMTRHMVSAGPRAAELQRHLAAGKLHTVEQVVGRLSGRTATATAAQTQQQLSIAKQELQRADRYLASRDYPAAWLHARRAICSLRLVERAEWESAVGVLDYPTSIPPAVAFNTLPSYYRWADRIRASRFGPNRLGGGNFEDLRTLIHTGWQHRRCSTTGIQTSADLLPAAAHSGSNGLRLTAVACDPENPPTVVETAPLWITTPNVPVEAGQIVCINGWVQIPKEITGSVDGLMIVDSLSGDALARRIKQTTDWRQFTIYRVAPQSGWMNVSFVLTGIGEVRLDDVMIQPLLPASVSDVTRRPPQ